MLFFRFSIFENTLKSKKRKIAPKITSGKSEKAISELSEVEKEIKKEDGD